MAPHNNNYSSDDNKNNKNKNLANIDSGAGVSSKLMMMKRILLLVVVKLLVGFFPVPSGGWTFESMTASAAATRPRPVFGAFGWFSAQRPRPVCLTNPSPAPYPSPAPAPSAPTPSSLPSLQFQHSSTTTTTTTSNSKSTRVARKKSYKHLAVPSTIYDSDQQFQVKMNVPAGFTKDNIHVSIQEDGTVLSIAGQKQQVRLQKQVCFGERFRLDSTIDIDQFHVNLDGSVLTVSAPKEIMRVDDGFRRRQRRRRKSFAFHNSNNKKMQTTTRATCGDDDDDDALFDEEDDAIFDNDYVLLDEENMIVEV